MPALRRRDLHAGNPVRGLTGTHKDPM